MEELKLSFHPSSDEVNSFLPFLKSEYEQDGKGMYCNWNVITAQSDKDQLITLHLNGKPISFVAWYRQDKVVELDIIWILPQFMGKGYGSKFLQLLTKEFKKRGDVALSVHCATEKGLRLARRSGFIPQNNNSDFSNENIELGRSAAYIKILRNSDALRFDNDDLTIYCYEEYGHDDSFYGKIPLSADFEKQPVYWFVNESWECKVYYMDKMIHQSKLEYLLKDLNIPLFNCMVAYIDHNIEVPKHWIK